MIGQNSIAALHFEAGMKRAALEKPVALFEKKAVGTWLALFLARSQQNSGHRAFKLTMAGLVNAWLNIPRGLSSCRTQPLKQNSYEIMRHLRKCL